MADQQSRGGEKQGSHAPSEGQREQQQHVHPEADHQRPAEGQPGGPKEKSKSGRSKDQK